MAKFKKSVTVPYDAQDVFDLVSDVENYPKFIRWITAMRVSNVQEAHGVKTCLADSVVGFKGFTERFATKVTADRPKTHVQADLVRGPFRRLQARWEIHALDTGGCTCALSIDYEFKNFFLSMLASANQEMAVERILGAFMAEAKQRYGGKISSKPVEPGPIIDTPQRTQET